MLHSWTDRRGLLIAHANEAYTWRMGSFASEFFGEGGAIARTLGEHYEPRQQQIEMAEAVAGAMKSRSKVLIEAPTGVGKSFAYLAPAIRRALDTKDRIIIATNTISLQEQLLEKDVPALRRAFEIDEEDLRIELVKGRGNYLSIRRLELASRRQDRLLADAAARRSLHVIEDWAYETEDGTLSTLPVLERPAVWDRVQSDAGNCMGRRCAHYEACFYQRARRRMEQARILICNHAIFFSDLALRAQSSDAGFLPKCDHVILDEAHSAEDVASDHFGLSLSEGRVEHLLRMLHHQRTQKGYLTHLGIDGAVVERLDAAIRAVLEAEAQSRVFFDALRRVAGGEGRSLRIREAAIVENTVTPVFRDVANRLTHLRDAVDRDEDRYELNSYMQRASAIAIEAKALVEQELAGCAYWVETTGSAGARMRVKLACSPVDVAPALREHLFERDISVTLTSATLTTTGGSFAHVKRRLGCEDAAEVRVDSPFDAAAQVKLIVDATMPDPRDPAFDDELARRVQNQAIATKGGVFALFTSIATMKRISAMIRPELEAEGLTVLVQTVDGPRPKLLEIFANDGSAVLFGVASFWQGVDVRGEALRNVIITRLPFDPPDRPLVQARHEMISEQGGDPFREDTLPRAVLRLRQGFGRLIRHRDDAGRVVILDPRIVTKSYGRGFLEALPVEPDVITEPSWV